MLTVKRLKPYYIKTDDKFIRVVLAYQYFTVLINNHVYQFVPIEANEILVNRHTGKVANIHAKFAFQKGKDVVYKTMTDLVSSPDFLLHLHSIAKPYIKFTEQFVPHTNEIDRIIFELERENIKRLINHALDERNEKLFNKLVKLL